MPHPSASNLLVDPSPEGEIEIINQFDGIQSISNYEDKQHYHRIALRRDIVQLPNLHSSRGHEVEAVTSNNRDAILELDSPATLQKSIVSGDVIDPPHPDPSLMAHVSKDLTAISAPMTCTEYTKSNSPNDVFVQCLTHYSQEEDPISPKAYLALETYDEPTLRKLISEEDQAKVLQQAKAVVASVPDSLYHKCSVSTLIESLEHAGYQKISHIGADYRTVKSHAMSTSDEYLAPRTLITPDINHQITIKFKKPRNACPLRIAYETPAFHRGTDIDLGGKIAYPDLRGAVMDTLYSIEVMKELHTQYPQQCECIGQRDVERRAKIHPSYASEREILLVSGDNAPIYIAPDEIEEIILDDACIYHDPESKGQWDLQTLKFALEDAGYPELVSKVHESQFCQMAHECSEEQMEDMLDDARLDAVDRAKTKSEVWNSKWW